MNTLHNGDVLRTQFPSYAGISSGTLILFDQTCRMLDIGADERHMQMSLGKILATELYPDGLSSTSATLPFELALSALDNELIDPDHPILDQFDDYYIGYDKKKYEYVPGEPKTPAIEKHLTRLDKAAVVSAAAVRDELERGLAYTGQQHLEQLAQQSITYTRQDVLSGVYRAIAVHGISERNDYFADALTRDNRRFYKNLLRAPVDRRACTIIGLDWDDMQSDFLQFHGARNNPNIWQKLLKIAK